MTEVETLVQLMSNQHYQVFGLRGHVQLQFLEQFDIQHPHTRREVFGSRQHTPLCGGQLSSANRERGGGIENKHGGVDYDFGSRETKSGFHRRGL